MANQARIRLIWPKTGRDWLAFLLILGLILGLVGNLLPKGQKEVQAGSVRLKVPQGWEVREISGGWALISPLEGKGDAFRENLTLLREPLRQPLPSPLYAQVVAQRAAQHLQDFAPGRIARVRLGSVEAVAFSAQGRYGGRLLEYLVYAFTVGQEGYQITLTAEPGKLSRLQGPLHEALSPLAALSSTAEAPPSNPPAPSGSPDWENAPAPEPGVWSPNLPSGNGALPAEPEALSGSQSPETPGLNGFQEVPPSGSDFWESWQGGENFNTWMAEEWSQLLSGETPEPTHQDEAGNLYWEGPSGILHEWGDYSGE